MKTVHTNWDEFNSDRQYFARRSRPKHDRPPDMRDPDGKRWKFSSRHQQYLQIDIAQPSAPMFTNSKTMCENRNRRLRSFGYPREQSNYSMRDRGWPYALHHGKPY